MHRRTIVPLLALLVAWIAGGSAAHAASWVPGPTITENVSQAPHVAIGPDGGATVLWADGPFNAATANVALRRVEPDGTAGAVHGVGHGVALDVATTAGGALAAWAEVQDAGTTLEVKTVTLDTTGVTRGSRSVSIPTGSRASESLGAVAPDGSVVVSWLEAAAEVSGAATLRVRRIAANGELGPVTDLGLAVTGESSYQLGVGSDGVARIVWRRPDLVGGGLLVGRINADGTGSTPTILTMDPAGTATLKVEGGHAIAGWIEAVTPGDMASLSTVRVRRLPSSASGPVADPPITLVPSLAAAFPGIGFSFAPDGSATAVWSETDAGLLAGVLKTRRIAPSGALGAIQAVSTPPAMRIDSAPVLANAADGTTIVAWVRLDLGAFSASVLSRSLTADGTPTGGEHPVTFSAATVSVAGATLTTGPAGVPFMTGLGVGADGSTAALLTSRFVAPPVVTPDTPPAPGPGPGPGPTPGPGPGAPSGPGPKAPSAERASARLKVTKATRKGARVTVAGTIDRRASGRVTLTWKQKTGRKTVTRTARATIKRGRFSTTLKLPRSLARSKAAGRLTVTYAGNATIARGTTKRTVKLPKAKKAKATSKRS